MVGAEVSGGGGGGGADERPGGSGAARCIDIDPDWLRGPIGLEEEFEEILG